MPYTLPAARRVRYEVWTDYPFAGGTCIDLLPRRDVVRCVTPDGPDPTQPATIAVVPSARTIAAIRPRRVLRLVPLGPTGTPGAPEYFRILADTLTLGAATATLTATAVLPLLDWGARRMRTTVGGRASFTFGGHYTPSDVLDLLLASLAARGRTEWTRGTVDRTDAQQIDWTGKTELEVLHLVEQQWALEPQVRCVGDAGFTLDLLNRVGGTAAVPILRLGGALQSLTRTRDASALATAVLPLAAAGGLLGLDAWTVASVTPGTSPSATLGLVDAGGGFGPVQRDGQLVGAYVQTPAGTRTLITATARGDGRTSLVTVADATGLAAASSGTLASVVELRADASGTRLLRVTDPGAIATYGEVEVPLERTDLTAARNFQPNPRGGIYTSPTAAPTGWTLTGGVTAATIARRTSGYPAGSPLGDLGVVWRWTARHADNVLVLPPIPVIDPVPGDAAVSYAVHLWVDAALAPYTDPSTGDAVVPPVPEVRLRNLSTSNVIAIDDADGTAGQTWLTLGGAGLALAAPAPLGLELTFRLGTTTPSGGTSTPLDISDLTPTGWDVYVVGAQLDRAATAQPYVDGAPINLLRQAANAYLLGYAEPPVQLDAVASDRSETDARYADQPLVPGGDVILRAAAFGVDARARFVARQRERTAPGAPAPLTLVAAVDPLVAAQQGAAGATRPRTLAEELLALARATG